MLNIQDDFASKHCTPILDKLWPILQAKKCIIVGLNQVYKNNYTTSAGGHIELDLDQPLPLRYIKSNCKNDRIDNFLSHAKAE